MAQKKINRGSLPMLKLTLPIAMEQFFRILVSSVDTMMLSSYSNEAVAAVGLVSQYVFFLRARKETLHTALVERIFRTL